MDKIGKYGGYRGNREIKYYKKLSIGRYGQNREIWRISRIWRISIIFYCVNIDNRK